MGRRRRIGIVLLGLLLVAGGVTQWWLGQHLEKRFRESLHEGARRGDVERVAVCLPCLSYTIHGVEVEDTRSDVPVRTRLSAERVIVGLDLDRLWRGSLRGRMSLPGAVFEASIDDTRRGRSGGTRKGIVWEDLGQGLFPFPFDHIEAPRSELILHYRTDAEPIAWHFGIEKSPAANLALDDGDPWIVVSGRTPGDGDFEFALRVTERDPPRSSFRGTLDAVPLEAISGYVKERFGFDAERGDVSASIDLSVTDSGWAGRVDCELAGLQLFELEDLIEQDPLQAANDGVGQLMTELRRDEDRVLRLRLDVEHDVEPDAAYAWPWNVAGHLVEWVLMAPFELPLRLVRAADG